MKFRNAIGKSSFAKKAFTLLEVMIAVAIFFSCMFAILALVSNALRSARLLQQPDVDPGVLASYVAMTNKLYEGPLDIPSELEDIYPDCRFDGEILEVGSNGFFRVDMIVTRRTGRRDTVIPMSVEFYRPESPPGSMTKGMTR
jgi:hypothetical protein